MPLLLGFASPLPSSTKMAYHVYVNIAQTAQLSSLPIAHYYYYYYPPPRCSDPHSRAHLQAPYLRSVLGRQGRPDVPRWHRQVLRQGIPHQDHHHQAEVVHPHHPPRHGPAQGFHLRPRHQVGAGEGGPPPGPGPGRRRRGGRQGRREGRLQEGRREEGQGQEGVDGRRHQVDQRGREGEEGPRARPAEAVQPPHPQGPPGRHVRDHLGQDQPHAQDAPPGRQRPEAGVGQLQRGRGPGHPLGPRGDVVLRQGRGRDRRREVGQEIRQGDREGGQEEEQEGFQEGTSSHYIYAHPHVIMSVFWSSSLPNKLWPTA